MEEPKKRKAGRPSLPDHLKKKHLYVKKDRNASMTTKIERKKNLLKKSEEEIRKISESLKGNKNAIGNSGQPPQLYTEEWIENEAKLLIEWFEIPRNIWLKGFALQRGYDPARLDEFADKSPEFAQALRKAKELQQFKLVDKAIFNETNAGFTKFVLQNNHGWAERQQIIGDPNSPLACLMTNAAGKSKDLISGNSDPD